VFVCVRACVPQEAGAERGQEARVATKHSCLGLLFERLLDKSAYVRCG
jgi:hypothetical protein